MKKIMLVLFLCGFAAAFSVHPDYSGVQDTGGQNLATLDVGITIDCDTKALAVDVSANDTGEKLKDASIFLFYTQYTYQLITSGTTGDDGIGTMDVVGNMDYLTTLFVLRVDHQGYKSREIEFAYEKCFRPPPVNQSQPPANQTQAPANQTQPANQTAPGNANQSNQTQPPANSGNVNQTNQSTGNQSLPADASRQPSTRTCLPAFLLLGVLALALVKPLS